jgi:prephenate dehydrogenase
VRAAGTAAVVGLGLIGGSIALALKRSGYRVVGQDRRSEAEFEALEKGVIDEAGLSPECDVAFVAVPSSAVVEVVQRLRRRLGPSCVITDTASVKAPIVEALSDPAFVGGHPMAGSEVGGLKGARPDMFEGATWVLCPSSCVDAGAYARVQTVVGRELGAVPLAMPAGVHDELVAVVSHLPHALAAILMTVASEIGEQEPSALVLAAGGFRDMTRVAASDPDIWPDIFLSNSAALLEQLKQVRERLGEFEAMIARGDAEAIREFLFRAALARRRLPPRPAMPSDPVEIRVRVPDRPGVLADVLEVARSLEVNIADVGITHLPEEGRGILSLVVDRERAEELRAAISSRGYAAAVGELG